MNGDFEMAFERLDSIVDRVIRRVMVDGAATAGTDADALKKMAAALGKQQPPSQGRTIEGTKGTGKTVADASRGHTPTALPTGKCFRTAIPERVAPPWAVRKHLTIYEGGRSQRWRSSLAPTDRSSRRGKTARETGLRIVGGHASAHEA